MPAFVALALTGCGGEDPSPATAPASPLVRQAVGSGRHSATIIRERSLRAPYPVVVFLHGWAAVRPQEYEPWLKHIARRGNAVIYPRYQDSALEPPGEVLTNALAGIRSALAAIPEDPASLVVAGHSAGGALAADYAAIARSVGLPVPAGVFSAYPGRAFAAQEQAAIPEIDPGRIGGRTRLLVLAGAHDDVVGTRWAELTFEGASRIPRGRRRYVLIEAPEVADHLAPQRDTRAARLAFWDRLDELIRVARLTARR